jgi:hypothetical protein
MALMRREDRLDLDPLAQHLFDTRDAAAADLGRVGVDDQECALHAPEHATHGARRPCSERRPHVTITVERVERLPIDCRAEVLELLVERDDGSWDSRRRFPLSYGVA